MRLSYVTQQPSGGTWPNGPHHTFQGRKQEPTLHGGGEQRALSPPTQPTQLFPRPRSGRMTEVSYRLLGGEQETHANTQDLA